MRWFCGSELLLPLLYTSFLLSQVVQELCLENHDALRCHDENNCSVWDLFRSKTSLVYVSKGQKEQVIGVLFTSFLLDKVIFFLGHSFLSNFNHHGKMKTHLIKLMKYRNKKNISIQIESPHLQPTFYLAWILEGHTCYNLWCFPFHDGLWQNVFQ